MRILYSGVCLLMACISMAQENIRINQLGFLPEAKKIAVIVDSNLTSFEVVKSSGTVVFTGTLSSNNYWNNSNENVRIADFSEFKSRGTYQIKLSDGSTSHPFQIEDDVFNPVSKGAIKAYYFNRASTALEEEYAGEYKRALGHPDDQVIVLPSAASEGRPAGTKISTPYGWYDAGDYNKYIVNSGISVFTLLSAYEQFPNYYDELKLTIPESGNNIPDILDEALWNIKWMATMQDPGDGGVYNKTTHANFQGAVMPHQATATRYVVAKGTAATLDFAAVMAMAARIYKPYLPEEAAVWLAQAELAWQWAQSNNNVAYNNPSSENGYPGVSTGGYGDGNFSDEFFWAAAELAISTENEDYLNELNFSLNFGNPGWPNVQTLGILSLIAHRKSAMISPDSSMIKQKLLNIVDGWVSYQKGSPYQIPNNNFYWGSNSEPGNQAMLLIQAYELTHEIDYFNTALAALDYLLGRNATGYSFVTGFGDKTPKNIHHRQSEADNIDEPVPGFLAGGPNPHNTNDCGSSTYPTLTPAKCYVDDWCSYSTNEITINWNAPLVFTSGALDYIYSRDFLVPDTATTVLGSIKSSIEIFPNPADDSFEIKGIPDNAKVEIFNVSGQLVKEATGRLVDITRVPKGTYLVTIQSKEVSYKKKLLVR